MTHLRRMMLEELQRRNYAKSTVKAYLRIIQEFASHFHQRPDKLGPQHLTFRWKDYARGSRQRTMAVGGEEFLRRFLLHVLPRGFVRIRFFGFLANRRRTQLLPLCQRLLEAISRQRLPAPQTGETKLPVSWLCPPCGGAMVLIEKFTAQEIRWKLAKASHFVDSS